MGENCTPNINSIAQKLSTFNAATNISGLFIGHESENEQLRYNWSVVTRLEHQRTMEKNRINYSCIRGGLEPFQQTNPRCRQPQLTIPRGARTLKIRVGLSITRRSSPRVIQPTGVSSPRYWPNSESSGDYTSRLLYNMSSGHGFSYSLRRTAERI